MKYVSGMLMALVVIALAACSGGERPAHAKRRGPALPGAGTAVPLVGSLRESARLGVCPRNNVLNDMRH